VLVFPSWALPLHVDGQISDGFNYPIGPRSIGSVTEARDGDGWYNAQDFGEFNPTYRGLHPGEDWNDERGGAVDIGASVYAVSNGKVVTIRNLGALGEALALEHVLSDASVVFSVYVHIRVDSSLQIGSIVSRDEKIGWIADITQSGLSPHLHFELRTTPINANNLWPSDLGNGYYASLKELQTDGLIVDPSDFIDTHRPSTTKFPIPSLPLETYLLKLSIGSRISTVTQQTFPPIFRETSLWVETRLRFLNGFLSFTAGLAVVNFETKQVLSPFSYYISTGIRIARLSHKDLYVDGGAVVTPASGWVAWFGGTELVIPLTTKLEISTRVGIETSRTPLGVSIFISSSTHWSF
jgi:hypothetical protein